MSPFLKETNMQFSGLNGTKLISITLELKLFQQLQTTNPVWLLLYIHYEFVIYSLIPLFSFLLLLILHYLQENLLLISFKNTSKFIISLWQNLIPVSIFRKALLNMHQTIICQTNIYKTLAAGPQEHSNNILKHRSLCFIH